MKNLRFYPQLSLDEVVTGKDVLIQLVYEALFDAVVMMEGNYDWEKIVATAYDLVKKNEAGRMYSPNETLQSLTLLSVEQSGDTVTVRVRVTSRNGEQTDVELQLGV